MFVYPLAREIALVNSLGLGLGIHCMYAATNYGALRDFGDQSGLHGWPFVTLLFGDFLMNFLPSILLLLAFNDEFTMGILAPRLSNVWIGVMTGYLHSTYTYFLGLTFDPGPVMSISLGLACSCHTCLHLSLSFQEKTVYEIHRVQ